MRAATRFWKRLLPPEGLEVFLLASLAIGFAVWGVSLPSWVPGDEMFWHSALVSLLLSRALWLRPASGWRSAVCLVVSGLLYTVWWATRIGTPVSVVVWAVIRREHKVAETWIPEVQTRLSRLGLGLAKWLEGLWGGETTTDSVVSLFLMSLMLWLAVAFAMWGLSRRKHPLLAFLPLYFLVAMSVYIAHAGQWQLLILMANVLAMTPLVIFARAEDEWKERRWQPAVDVRGDILMVAVVAWSAYVLVAAPFPNLRYWPLVERFWDTVQGRDRAAEEAVRRAFPGADASAFGDLAGLGAGARLPREHLLGSGPELERIEVMLVRTDDPPPSSEEGIADGADLTRPEVIYWRGTTYSQYVGSGWRWRPWGRTLEPPYGPLGSPDAPGRRPLRQDYTLLLGHGDSIFAAGEPQSVDQAVTRRWLADKDDVTALESGASQYQVLSLIPHVSAYQLWWAGTKYPTVIWQAYLDLPEIPARVDALARSVTANYTSPYGQALAIQEYLRAYAYDLEVPLPPASRDVVDYFLFDLQRGYCDYFATAMVVMARVVGIPSRLAVGYAMGEYDFEREAYLVKAKHAHAWPELYFPDFGWIPFEPTTGYPSLNRVPDDQAVEVFNDKPSGIPLRTWWTIAQVEMRVLWIHRKLELLMGAAALVGLSALAWWWNRATLGRDVRQRAIVGYLWMRELAPRIGVDVLPSDTPAELAAAILERLRMQSPRWKWAAATVEREVAAAAGEVPLVADTYERLSYAPTPPEGESLRQVAQAGRRLRSRMWRIWLLSWSG